MPVPAVKPLIDDEATAELRLARDLEGNPLFITSPIFPDELNDRSEGWGMLGTIFGYPQFKDDGEWPTMGARQNPFEEYPTETNDNRATVEEPTEGAWTHEDFPEAY